MNKAGFPLPGALVVLAALWLAALVVGGPETRLDMALLNAAAIPALVPIAQLLTMVGSGAILIPLGLAAAVTLAIRKKARRAWLLIALIVSGRLLVELQKLAFDRARPDPAGHLTAVHSMAFPSGHAANSMMLGLGIAMVIVPQSKWRLPIILIALLFSGLVGLSRLVLGVHWPSDVAGGWAFGIFWTLILVRLAGSGKG